MDHVRFDTLTRSLTSTSKGSRRLTLATLLGSALGLLGVAHLDGAAAKKPCPPCKKRKQGKCKKKRPDGTACPGGTCQSGRCVTRSSLPAGCPSGSKTCEGTCISTNQCCSVADCPPLPDFQCCNGLCTDQKNTTGDGCANDTGCCTNYCRVIGFSSAIGDVKRCAPCRGKACNASASTDCCREYACQRMGGTPNSYCGGCKDSGDLCKNAADCCFSDCTSGPSATLPFTQCLSFAGGPCEKDWDCHSCHHRHQCTFVANGSAFPICTAGTCGCPDECCSHDDCDNNENCVFEFDGLGGTCQPQVGEP